jgi:hypothetical protein
MRWLVNNETEGIWKVAVLDQFGMLSGHLPDGTEDIQEKLVSMTGFRVEI